MYFVSRENLGMYTVTGSVVMFPFHCCNFSTESEFSSDFRSSFFGSNTIMDRCPPWYGILSAWMLSSSKYGKLAVVVIIGVFTILFPDVVKFRLLVSCASNWFVQFPLK